MTYHLTSSILGLLIAGTLLWLIRQDRLHTRHALWWLLVATIVVFLGMFPRVIDFVAGKLGINYPPTLVFILGLGMILIKVLMMDIHQSELERKMRRLAQRLAILEGEKYQSRDNQLERDKYT